MRFATTTLACVLLLAERLASASEPDLAGARELFRQNRWAEAREAIASEMGSLSRVDRDQARFLLGLSHIREAELYRALSFLSADVGLAYMKELALSKERRALPWVPLFRGLYQLDAGRYEEAESALAEAALSKSLTAEWKKLATARRDLARSLKGRRPSAVVEAEVEGVDLDVPDVEDASDPKKILRFFDPLRLETQERRAWKSALSELSPLAREGQGMANKFGRFYAGYTLFFLGETREAASLLEPIDLRALGPDYHARARVIKAASSEPEDVAALWESTRNYPEAVLLWNELSPGEPIASALSERLKALPQSFGESADETMVGRWGLAALSRGPLWLESKEVLVTLSRHRNHANKNKIEWNDPLLLVALAAANYSNNDYPQALETLFELAKSFEGLRGLQWNLQGVYAARQKAAGDARIAN
jgi:tetratricopeptide (TPR) repeat protein